MGKEDRQACWEEEKGLEGSGLNDFLKVKSMLKKEDRQWRLTIVVGAVGGTEVQGRKAEPWHTAWTTRIRLKLTEKGQAFLQTVPKEDRGEKKEALYEKTSPSYIYIVQRNPISESQNNNDNDDGDNSK